MAIAIIWLVLGVLVLFSIGYLTYSRYLAQFVELDDSNETPAHKYEDGQEYVPAKKPVLLGHHYSSIAGGAPIVGPITAGVIWGWIPALLWIAIGNPLLGATHDFISLSSSLRHEGKSIGYIIGEYVGERGKNMLLWFAFLTIILVVGVFAFVVGVVFEGVPERRNGELLVHRAGHSVRSLPVPTEPAVRTGNGDFRHRRVRQRLRRAGIPDRTRRGNVGSHRPAVRVHRERPPGVDAPATA